MSELNSIVTVEYHKNKYTIASLQHSKNMIPIVLDRHIYKTLKKLNKKWYINDKNHIYCIHTNDYGESHIVYMHDVIIKLNPDIKYMYNTPIIHINNIHFDNRLSNLQFDVINKDHTKNIKKKRRTIDLSNFGINVDDLPTYIWYLKPDKTHGARFVIDIAGKISWRSTASKKVSLRYKLEEAKKYLRYILLQYPTTIEQYSMNGDLTAIGLQLYKEYQILISKAGFSINVPSKNNTKQFLSENKQGLNDMEIFILNLFDPAKNNINISSAMQLYQVKLLKKNK